LSTDAALSPTEPPVATPLSSSASPPPPAPEMSLAPSPTPGPLLPDTPLPDASQEPQVRPQGFLLEGIGFRTPESVLYDPESDTYLVSNINGSPMDKDGNGFISRIAPGGELLALRWIDGEAEGVTLNAPKGMAVSGAALYVADIDAVRIFDRRTGVPHGDVEILGAQFLNDTTAAPDGTIYVTDSATGLVHSITEGQSVERFDDVLLKGPNGIVAGEGSIWVAVEGSLVLELGSEGQALAEYRLPGGGLDGLIRLDDGTLLASSWQGSAIYRIDPTGQASELFAGLSAPADIGFDTKRGLVLIPHFEDDRVEARPLP
jgi:hypothetical protein